MSAQISFAADKVTYDDQLMPILRNECVSCHNPDKKKAGLDVSSYTALMAGGDGGPVVNSGDPDGSPFYQVVAHTKDPYMPKGKGKLPDMQIELFKRWIAAGALQNASGKPAIAKNKPKINLSVVASAGKPKGPAIMPHDLLVEPIVHTARPGAIMCLAASPWAPLVAIGGQHQVLLYDTQSLELTGVLPYLDGDPYVAKFSRNGGMLLVGGGIAAKSGHVILFDVATGTRITQVGDEFDAVIAADISPDQSMVALGGPGKTLKIYSTSDGQLLHAIKKHTDWVTAIAYSPDGVLLASGDRQGGLWIWEAKTGNEFYGLTGHKAGITDICFRGDSNLLASASEDGTVKLWDMNSGKIVRSWNAHSSGVLSVSFAHDGRIVTCGRDRVVRVWKPDGGGLLTTQPFGDIALKATFDGDDQRIVAGDWTGTVRVFDAKTGKPVGELSADPLPIAQRLDQATNRLAEAQNVYQKAAEEFAVVRRDSYKAETDRKAAELAIAETRDELQRAREYEKRTSEALKSAQAQATQVQEGEAQQASSQKPPTQQLQAEQRYAQQAVAKLEQSLNASQRLVPEKAERAKTAAQRIAKMLPQFKRLEAQLQEARARVARLKAAQFNVKVWSAKDELSHRQQELEKLTGQQKDAQAAADKAAADVAAAQQALAQGPQRIQMHQDAIVKAKQSLAAANQARDAAQTDLIDREVLSRQASDLCQRLSQAATRESTDKALADSAAKAKAALDSLDTVVTAARQTLAAREDAIRQARDAIASVEQALEKEKAALQDIPGKIESLKHLAQLASAAVAPKKDTVDAMAKTVADCKAHVEQLSAEYHRLSQEASAPPALSLTRS